MGADRSKVRLTNPFINDLQASRDLGCAVTIRTLAGEKLIAGVRDLDNESGYVVVGDPQVLGDERTMRTVLLSDITSVTLHTDIAYWPESGNSSERVGELWRTPAAQHIADGQAVLRSLVLLRRLG